MMVRNKKGKCFIDKKPCHEGCVLYRKGLRYFDDKRPPEPFEECAINIIADGVENMITRTAGLQAEQNKATNAMTVISSVLNHALEKNIRNNKMIEEVYYDNHSPAQPSVKE